MENVLLVAPTFLDLYKDIINECETLGYNVDFIPEKAYKYDPYNILRKNKFKLKKSLFERVLKKHWMTILKDAKYQKRYDYLLVVDGMALHHYLFSFLRRNNPSIKCINYLFDRTADVYQFNRNFHLFDRVVSFDPFDVKKYGLEFLPIYWVKGSDVSEESRLSVFGFGSFNSYRKEIFLKIQDELKDKGLKTYIKLYALPIKNETIYRIKYFVRKVLQLPEHISIEEYKSELVTFDRMSPDEFRRNILRSDVILDTSAPYQDGLTARFMWAVGAGKKVITTNRKVINYDFYSKDQVFIIGKEDFDGLTSFIISDTNEYDNTEKLMPYRIDNWIKFLLS